MKANQKNKSVEEGLSKLQPTKLMKDVQRIRDNAFVLFEALSEVQPYVNGWMGSEKGKAIVWRVNYALAKARGDEVE